MKGRNQALKDQMPMPKERIGSELKQPQPVAFLHTRMCSGSELDQEAALTWSRRICGQLSQTTSTCDAWDCERAWIRAICSLSHTIREPLSATCEGKDEQPATNKAPLKARISFMAAPSFHRDYRQKEARLQGRFLAADRWRRGIRFKARARQRYRNGAGRRYRARI